MRNRIESGLLALVVALVPGAVAHAAQDQDPVPAVTDATPPPAVVTDNHPAERMPLAQRSLLLDIGESAQRAIAVGVRGHVLVSESRQDWRQVDGVPTRATLTAVTAVGEHAWAVGHDQAIVHSADGGLSWELQRYQPFSEEDLDNPRNGVPLLDVLFLDADHGFAVGAYALMLRTSDGGSSWSQVALTGGVPSDVDGTEGDRAGDEVEDEDSWTFSEEDLELDAVGDPHLNGIVQTGDGSLFIAAERGSAFRSTDQGETWERIELPYQGSMFGAIGYDDRRVLVFGLRGNVFVTDDLGATWTAVDTGTEQSLQGGARLGEDGAVLVGNNGLVLWRTDADAPFRRASLEDAGVFASVLPIGGSGQLVVVGENGIERFSATSTEAAE